MMPRWSGVVSRSSLFLFTASRSPSIVEFMLPSAPSTTVSQLLWMSSHAAFLLFPPPSLSPPLVVPRVVGPLNRPVDLVAWLLAPSMGCATSSSDSSSATYSPSESAMAYYALYSGLGLVILKRTSNLSANYWAYCKAAAMPLCWLTCLSLSA
jgi:hypothetical protein